MEEGVSGGGGQWRRGPVEEGASVREGQWRRGPVEEGASANAHSCLITAGDQSSLNIATLSGIVRAQVMGMGEHWG